MEGRENEEQILTRKLNFMKTVKAGAEHGAGSRHQRKRAEAIERALQSKSKAEAAKILRRIK